ncbi:hypothetical protein FXW25_05275 [Candidatus Liberibacter asiaticus]|nr:hypothetical protein FXW25_05275 [Candidatus Liberibacter asiaticus]KAE9515977.1 hypothetical protein FXW26_00025 [Candidatus Liberibacter asiaticus]
MINITPFEEVNITSDIPEITKEVNRLRNV